MIFEAVLAFLACLLVVLAFDFLSTGPSEDTNREGGGKTSGGVCGAAIAAINRAKHEHRFMNDRSRIDDLKISEKENREKYTRYRQKCREPFDASTLIQLIKIKSKRAQLAAITNESGKLREEHKNYRFLKIGKHDNKLRKATGTNLSGSPSPNYSPASASASRSHYPVEPQISEGNDVNGEQTQERGKETPQDERSPFKGQPDDRQE